MTERQIVAGGVTTRIAEAGPVAAPPLVLIPPGLFGAGTLNGLYCASLRLWDTVLPTLAASHRVIALDTLGQGGTGAGAAPPALDAALDHLVAVLDALGIARAHLVGHDEGAMLAIRLAFRDPARVASLGLVSCPSVAPSGDGLNPVVLANPLEPILSARGQAWALEHVSHAPHHITPALLEEAVAIGAASAAHDAVTTSRLLYSMTRAKGATFADLRETGLPVPAALYWGANDPVAGPAYGRALFEWIAPRQPAAQMHLINRAGYFAYREQPRLFAGLVAGFVRAVGA